MPPAISLERRRTELCCAIIEKGIPFSWSDIRSQVIAELKDFSETDLHDYLRFVLLVCLKEEVTSAFVPDTESFMELFREVCHITSPLRAIAKSSAGISKLFRPESLQLFDVPEEMEAGVFEELRKHQERLIRSRFTLSTEAAFRKAMYDWLCSGTLSSEQWESVRTWHASGSTLSSFRKHVSVDPKWPKRLCKAMLALDTWNNFNETEKIHKTLDAFCTVRLSKTGAAKNLELRVEAGVLVISTVLNRIEKEIRYNDVRSVAIYAVDRCILDASLYNCSWSGISLTIVTKQLTVTRDVVIDLSGADAPQREEQRQATSSKMPDFPGADGKCGKAGSSSGNLLICAELLEGGVRLKLVLNGGNGEDGEHGGNGCDGEDGVGVKESDINFSSAEAILIKNPTAFFAGPLIQLISDPEVRWRTNDNMGRLSELTKVFVGIGCFYAWSIHGTTGTRGSQGGAGAHGGEGGYAGTCQIIHSLSKAEWNVGELQATRGNTGKDGDQGRNGRHGKDGNDMCKVMRAGNIFNSEECITPNKKLIRKDVPLNGATKPIIRYLFDEVDLKEKPTKDIPKKRVSRESATAMPTLQHSTALSDFVTVSARYNINNDSVATCAKKENAIFAETETQVHVLVDHQPRGEAQRVLRNSPVSAKQLWMQLLEQKANSENIDASARNKILEARQVVSRLFESQSPIELKAIVTAIFHVSKRHHGLPASITNERNASNIFCKLTGALLQHSFADSEDLEHTPLMLEYLTNSEARVLLVAKLVQESSTSSKKKTQKLDVLNMLRVLQNDRVQLRSLAQRPLHSWTTIAAQLNWSEMESNDRSLGRLAYYIGKIEDGEKQSSLRKWIHQSKRDEPTIALMSQLLSSGEIDSVPLAGIDALKRLDRNAREIANLVVGITDHSEESKHSRRTKVNRIAGGIVKADEFPEESQLTDIECALGQFDEALHTIKNVRLRPAQRMAIMCALESEQNLLQQVATGEGKSFIIAAIAAVRCLKNPTVYVDIVTSSSVLAERDAKAMELLYAKLGLTVAHNCCENEDESAKSYKARILYGDMAHFQRDHLRHHVYRTNIRGSRTHDVVIVDEVDSMMLDNGNHVLYLSHDVPSLKLLDFLFALIQSEVHEGFGSEKPSSTEEIRHRIMRKIFGQVSKSDLEMITGDLSSSSSFSRAQYIYDVLKEKSIIDDEGYFILEDEKQFHGVEHTLSSIPDISPSILYDSIRVELERDRPVVLPDHLHRFVRHHLATFIDNCKRAALMLPEVDYVLDEKRNGVDNEPEQVITIIDGDTGADLASTQWAGGLHQFLQLKHACRLSPLSLKAVFVSNVTYLNKYNRIYGLSGTLGSIEESRTLVELYEADLIRIPTNQPRLMSEIIPVLTTGQLDFIRELYIRVETEVNHGRSVLVICECIDELRKIDRGLQDVRETSGFCSAAMSTCLETKIVYTRGHDNLDYEHTPLDAGRLIIATNLAGRGTDIKLSKKLIDAGGLHVIVTFVPRNRRVEEQAFGRAARSGVPGSAQIIAVVHDGSTSVFDFKERRDEVEADRISRLKCNFDFRIEIEEACLERFLDKFDRDLFRNTSNSEASKLPEAEDVIYKALLDEWTLWLDGQEPAIDECASKQSVDAKKCIIDSVEDFVQLHNVEVNNGLMNVPEWLVASEWLLRIGIIQASHEDGRADAWHTFDRLIRQGGDFAAYAYYYQACMQMEKWGSIRPHMKSLVCNGAVIVDSMERSSTLFARARALFSLQLERRDAEVRGHLARAVGQINDRCGLQRQHNERTVAYHNILGSIDWLIGEPLSPSSFRPLTSNEDEQRRLFRALRMLGVISQPLLAGVPAQQKSTAEASSLAALPHLRQHEIQELFCKFELCHGELERSLDAINKDLTLPSGKDGKRAVRSGDDLEPHISLPSRQRFWRDMMSVGAFKDIAHVFVVAQDREQHVENALGDTCLRPIQMEAHQALLIIRYSEKPMYGAVIYSEKELRNLTESSDSRLTVDEKNSLRKAVTSLLKNGDLERDIIARIDTRQLNVPPLLEYDGFTAMELQEYLQSEKATVMWVISLLEEAEVIEPSTVQRTHLSTDWRHLISDHARDKDENYREKFLPRLEAALHSLECSVSIEPALLMHVIRRDEGNNNDDAETIEELHTTLLQLGVLYVNESVVYRLRGAIDCSCLPSMLADSVQRFLSHSFSFTFSIRALSAACADSLRNASQHDGIDTVVKQTMLPEDPYGELYTELIRIGLIEPPRILSGRFEVIDHDDFDFVNEETLTRFINARRYKLDDKIQMFTLAPFTSILRERGSFLSEEMRALIEIGMPAGITLRDVSQSEKVLGTVWRYIANGFNKSVAGLKYVLSLVGTAIGTVSAKVGDALGYCLDAAAVILPKQVHKAAYFVVSGTVDLLAFAFGSVNRGISWVGEQMMNGASLIGGKLMEFETMKNAASAIAQSFNFVSSRCRAMFGSAEYYQQCRMAAHELRNYGRLPQQMDELRLLRMYNQMQLAGNEEARATEAKERDLVDWMLGRARQLVQALSTLINDAGVLYPYSWKDKSIDTEKKFAEIDGFNWLKDVIRDIVQLECMRTRCALSNIANGNAIGTEQAYLTATFKAALAHVFRELDDSESSDEQKRAKEQKRETNAVMERIQQRMKENQTDRESLANILNNGTGDVTIDKPWMRNQLLEAKEDIDMMDVELSTEVDKIEQEKEKQIKREKEMMLMAPESYLRDIVATEVRQTFIAPLEKMISDAMSNQTTLERLPDHQAVMDEDLAQLAALSADDEYAYLHEILDEQLSAALGADANWPGRERSWAAETSGPVIELA